MTTLKLAKKLVAANPVLAKAVKVKAREIERLDGAGSLQVWPPRTRVGAHGKTYLFVGFDEIHGYRTGTGLKPSRPIRRGVMR